MPGSYSVPEAGSVRRGQTGEQAQHRAQGDGLGQVGVEAALERAATILGEPVARQRDEEHVAAERLAEPSRDAVPVEARQSDVDEGHVGARLDASLDAL